MNTQFFVGMLVFGALIGGFLGGFNWKHIKGSDRDQKVVATKMIVGIVVGAVVFGVLGFFIR